MALPQPETTSTPTFEVERFGWTAAGCLEVTGRWYGVRGRRFVRPTLDVEGRQGRRRLLASLEHKPWAPGEGEPWTAAFPWEGATAGLDAAQLAVAPRVVVALPPPGAPPDAAAGRRTADGPADGAGAETGEPAAALLRRLATLRREHVAITAERDEALGARGSLERERDEALAARDAARRDLAVARHERDEALAAREAAPAAASLPASPDDASAKRLKSERDALAGELDAMRHERAAARRERNELLSSHDATLAARAQAERERDEALAQRDAAAEQLQALLRERGAARQREQARPAGDGPHSTRTPRATQTREAERRLTRALTVATLTILAVLAVLLLSALL